MTIEINDKLIGMWFVPLTKHSDYLAGLSRSDTEGKLILTYRFRYDDADPTHPQDPHDPRNKDRKKWVSGTISDTEGNAVAKLREMVMLLAAARSERLDQPTEILVENGDLEAFIKKLQAQDFANTRTYSIN